MKTELSKIAQDLEQGTITNREAQILLLGLLGVSGSLDDIPLNEKHFKFIIKFPTKKIEFKEIYEKGESIKVIDLDW